jgi:septum formation protein
VTEAGSTAARACIGGRGLAPELTFVLASRSPRRLELLAQIVPRERIRVLPPASPEEPGFEGLRTRAEIEARLMSIAVAKRDEVLRRLGDDADRAVVLAADTTIIVGECNGAFTAIGQPPESDWRETTRRWFLEHYAGRTHLALTALCVATPTARRSIVATTRVTFRDDAEDYLDWYLSTNEPCGKAGGYAIQGAGSIFIERVEGSLTNVIGLPLRELLDLFRDLNIMP